MTDDLGITINLFFGYKALIGTSKSIPHDHPDWSLSSESFPSSCLFLYIDFTVISNPPWVTINNIDSGLDWEGGVERD